MKDHDYTTMVRNIADLRMQINALEISAKSGSLPETVKEARSTIRWSALVIAAALVVSSGLKLYGDGRVRALEQRVEALEQRTR